jgi:hypothetical protein
MAKDNTIWIILGVILAVVVVAKFGPGLFQTQSMLTNGFSTQSACQASLDSDKASYPQGYYSGCVLVTSSINTCLNGCGSNTYSLTGKYNYEWGIDGQAAMSTVEKCRATCLGGGSQVTCTDAKCKTDNPNQCYGGGSGTYWQASNSHCVAATNSCEYDLVQCTEGCNGAVCGVAPECTQNSDCLPVAQLTQTVLNEQGFCDLDTHKCVNYCYVLWGGVCTKKYGADCDVECAFGGNRDSATKAACQAAIGTTAYSGCKDQCTETADCGGTGHICVEKKCVDIDCPITINSNWDTFWSSVNWPGLANTCAPESCNYITPTGIIQANIRVVPCCTGLVQEKQGALTGSSFVAGGEYGTCVKESGFCSWFGILKDALPDKAKQYSCTIGIFLIAIFLLVLLKGVAR